MNYMQNSVMKVAELGRLGRTWKKDIQLILLDKWKWRERLHLTSMGENLLQGWYQD